MIVKVGDNNDTDMYEDRYNFDNVHLRYSICTKNPNLLPYPSRSTHMHKFLLPRIQHSIPFSTPYVLSSIRTPRLGQRIPTNHNIHLEISIPLHPITLIIQPRQNLTQKIRLRLIAPLRLKLSQPNRSAPSHSLRLADMVLEILHAVVGRETVPVDGEEIDMASGAAGEEGGQVRETLVLGRAVAHRGGTELDVPVVFGVEGFHVGVPAVDGLADVHVGLGAEVGFVEGEEMFAAGGDGGFGFGDPGGGVVGGQGVPEHGDEFLGGVHGAAGGGIPVVEPADVGVVEVRGQGGFVVDEAAGDDVIGGGSDGGFGRGGRGSGGLFRRVGHAGGRGDLRGGGLFGGEGNAGGRGDL